MPIDNDVYNRDGEGWWEEDNPLNILHGSITPGRFAYFREVLTDRLGPDLRDLRALDIGCGGGFLAESLRASDSGWSGWILLRCRSRRHVATPPPTVSISTIGLDSVSGCR